MAPFFASGRPLSAARLRGPALMLLLAVALTSGPIQRAHAAPLPAGNGPEAIATRLSTMLQSARSVISRHQARINDPALGDKQLGAAVVIAEAVAAYRDSTGEDPMALDPQSRLGRLIKAQIASIDEVMNEAQASINQKGVGFKGFIPATFARLVNEAFARRVGAEASVKVTAPPKLVRNRKARPDAWETAVINDRFLVAGWTRGMPFAEVVNDGGSKRFRMALPEYYASTCLSCHGAPQGSTDVTGYPREGAAEHDLGGVISVVLSEP